MKTEYENKAVKPDKNKQKAAPVKKHIVEVRKKVSK